MDKLDAIYFSSRDSWRKWLIDNHAESPGIWVGYYKQKTGKPTISVMEGVEEALCFGWINSTIHSIDEERYIQKYLPRKNDNIWSKVSKDAAERMIKAGKMTQSGFAKIEAAKKKGAWQTAYTSKQRLDIPEELQRALKRNPSANLNFANFANTYNNMYVGWVNDAKTEGTRKRRIEKVVNNAEKDIKQLYM